MTNQKKYKLLLLTTFSFIITTTLFQNCSPVKIGQNLDLSSSIFSEGISYAPKSVSGAQVITNGNVILREYRHKSSNRYFYTSRVDDQVLLDTKYVGLFDITGNSITVKAATDAGLSPVYRLSNKGGFHLYTAELNERTSYLSDSKFQDEGIEGYAIKINPAASCPTSPSVTYPVFRLSHNGSYKYRLVTDAALKSQLLNQGYTDEGILFCATAVSSTPSTVVGSASCSFGSTMLAHGVTATGYFSEKPPCNSQLVTCNNGSLSNPSFHYNSCTPSSGSGGACSWTWADDFSSAAPVNRPRPTTGCTSTNDGQKQNGVAGAADWTCMCDAGAVIPPPPASGAACNFGTTTLAHGATATGYSSATGSCTSQLVTCTNGNLSNPSFNFNTCSSVVSANSTDYCPTTPVRRTLNALDPYKIFFTSDNGASFQDGDDFVIQLNVAANDTTVNRYLASLEFADNSATRGGRYVTVSRSKCDYTSTAQWVSQVYLGAHQAVSRGSATVAIGPDNRPADVHLATPGRWYVNIRNVPGACPANISCHALLRWAN